MLSEKIRESLFNTEWHSVLASLEAGGMIPHVRQYGKDFKFGVEIELEGHDFPGHVPPWILHHEGSLRGEGVEYVTNGPMSSDGLQNALATLRREFREKTTKLNKTYRASTHIHYNVQHRTLDHILKAVVVFMCFEPLVVNLCGPERDGNLFCLPSYDCGDTVMWFTNLMTALSGKNKDILPFQQLHRGKYAALNTDPLTRFGTLECRIFPSSTDPKVILPWCSWLDNILGQEYDLVSFVKNLEANADSEIERVFGNIPLPCHAKSLIGFGVEQAWPLAVLYERTVK